MFFRSRTKRGLRRVTQSHTHRSILPSERQWYVFKELFTKHYGYVGYGIVFFLIVLVTSYPYISHANISVFYPSSCLGGWEHPEHAAGEPTLSEKSGAHEFTSENAAVIHDASASIYCGSFGGDVPQESTPKKFVLHLSLAVDNGDVTHDEVVSPLETTTTENGDAVITPTLDEAVLPPQESGDQTDTTIENAPSDAVPDDTSTPDTTTSEPASGEQTAPTESAPSDDAPVSFLQRLFPGIEKVFAEDVASTDTTPVETAPEETTVPPEPAASVESDATGATPETPSVETDIPAPQDVQLIVPTLDEATDTTTIITPEEQSESAILQVNYTLDGITWKELGAITREHWQNQTFELPLASWDDLSKFQVELKTLPTLDSNPHIYLDGMSIEVENEKAADTPTILLKDPSVILSGSETYNGNETPSFDVLTPDLSTIDILGLVQSDRAEVLEDKSGVLGTNNPASTVLAPNATTETIPSETDKKTIFEKAVDAVQSIFTASPEETTPVEPTPSPQPISFFHAPIPKKKFNSVNLQAIGTLLIPTAHAQDAPTQTIETTVLDVYDRPTDITAHVVSVFDKGRARQQIKIDKPTEHYRPGLYKLKIIVHTAQATVVSEQDFTWGVLSINTDKSVYLPGNTAYLQMSVLTDEGHTVCDADLELDITSPNGGSTHFSTGDDSIVRESKCQVDNVTEVPDYYAHFPIPSTTGTYTMHLTATTKNGVKTITDQFEVQSSVPLDVVRSGPTRINPIAPYPVTLHITSDTEWSGTVTEIVPKEFTISKPKHSTTYDHTAVVGNTKVITWNAHVVPGKETTLGYVFDAPDQSPEFYLLGPAQFTAGDTTTFTEARRWQIASDGSCQTTGVTSTWSLATTWTGTCTGTGGKPGAGDTVTINSGQSVTMDEASAVMGSLAVNGTLNTSNGTSWGLSATDITIGSTGTLTANASTITLSGTTGTLFTLTGGGTFTAGTSTVVMNPNASITTTSGTITFNNLTFSPAMATNNKTYTMGSGALTINGNWSIAPTTNAFVLFINMGADITVASTGTVTVGGTTATSNLKLHPASTDYNLTAGFINITAQGTIDGTSSSSVITLNGTSGTLFTKAGTFNQGTTEVKVTSASGTPTLLSTGTIFHRLTINSTATVINAGGVINMNNTSSANRLYIQAGVLNDGGSQIAGTANGTFVMDAGTALCIGGTTAATNATCDSGATQTTVTTFPTNYTNGNITLSTTSTVYYNANGAQTISSTPTYGNVTFRPVLSAARTFTFASGATTINGALDSTPTSNSVTARILSVNLNTGGLTVAGSTTIEGRTTTGAGSTTFSTTVSNFAMTTGSMNIVTGSTFTVNSSTLTFTGTSGTLLQRTGTFTAAGASAIIKFTPDASVTLTDNSTYTFNTVQFTPVLTADRTYTLGSGAVTYNSGADFTINPSASTGSTTARLTVTLGAATTINAAKTTTVTATQTGGSVITSTLDTKSGSNFALSTGFLSIGAAGTLTAQGSTITLTGTTAAANLITFTSGATFNAGTSTVSITGVTNSNIINSTAMTGTNKLNNLTLNCTGVTKSLGAALEVGGTTTVTLGTLDTDSTNNYALTTGKISIANSASAIFKAEASTVTLTGTTSTLFTRGASGVFTQGTSNVKVTAAGAASTGITLMSGTATFHILTINVPSTVVINAGAAITTDNVAGNKLYVQTGAFNDGGNQITAGTSGTLQVDASATFCIGGTAAGTNVTCNSGAVPTTATTFPAFTTVTLDSASTVIYAVNAAQTISAQTYGNLKLIPVIATAGKTYTFGGAATINGDFTIQPSSGAFLLTVNLGGTTTVASTKTTTITRSNSSTATLDTISGSNFAFSTGFLNIATGGTLTAQNSTITLTGTSGTLFTRVGTFTQGGSTVQVTSASGSPTLMSGTVTVHILTINAAATVINAGAAITTDNVAGNKFYVQSGVFNMEGNAITPGTSGTLQVDSTGTLCLGGTTGATSATCDSGTTQTSAVTFPAFTTVTLDSASTVIYLSDAAQTVANAPTYGNLKLGPKLTTNRIYTAGGALTINGNFDIKPPSGAFSLTVNMAGTITVAAGKTTTIQPTTATAILDTRPSTTDYNLSTGFLNIASGGTLDCTGAASTISITGTSGTLFTLNGTFTAGSSTVTLSGNGTATVNSGSAPTFFNLTSSGTGTKTLGTNISVGGVLSITTGTFAASSFTITLSGTTGTPFTNSATFDPGTGTVTYTGNNAGGNTTILSGNYYNLTTNNASETYVLSGTTTLDPAGTLTITDGTLSTTGTNYSLSFGFLSIANSATAILSANASTITVTGTSGTLLTRGNNGVFTAGTSTVNLAGNGSATINSSVFSNASNSSLYNLTSSGTGTKTFGANINVDNVLSVTNGTFAVSSFTLRLGGTSGTPFSNSGTFDPGTGTVTYTGDNAGGTTTVAAVPYYNLTLNNGTETYVLAGATTADPAGVVTVSAGTLDTTSGSNYALSAGSVSISSGATLTANASTITLTGTSGTLFTKNASGTFTAGTSTLVFSPDAAVTLTNNTPITVYNLSLTPNISVDRTYTFGTSALTVSGDFTINPTATASSKTLTVSMGNSITVDTAKTTTIQGSGGNNPTGKLDTGGSAFSTGALTINTNGLLKANASTITVAGNWTNSGTFTKDTSLVTLNSAITALVTGATAFYDLTITHSAAKEVDFQTSGSPVFDVSHTFTVTGHAGNLIKLYSDSSGTKWQFHPTGTAVVDYADVKDGGCQAGAITMTPTHSTGSNVDACWGLSALSFTFDNDDATIGFGTLDSSNPRFATANQLGSGTDSAAANNFTISTSATSGYTLTYYGDTLKSGSNSIAAASITNDADGTPGTAAFGLSVSTNGSSTIATGYDHNATAGLRDWTFVPNTVTTLASYNSSVSSPETISAYYLANIGTTTPAGSYSTAITYVVTGNF